MRRRKKSTVSHCATEWNINFSAVSVIGRPIARNWYSVKVPKTLHLRGFWIQERKASFSFPAKILVESLCGYNDLAVAFYCVSNRLFALYKYTLHVFNSTRPVYPNVCRLLDRITCVSLLNDPSDATCARHYIQSNSAQKLHQLSIVQDQKIYRTIATFT